MYWKYVLRRLASVLFTYVIIIFIYSALFNTVMETTIRAQIDEQVKQEMLLQTQIMSPAGLKQYQEERLALYYKRYHLDEPILSRIFWRALSTLKFDFGNSTIIRSAAGERKVLTIVAEKIPRTVLLFTLATAIDILIGVFLGMKKAQKPGKFLDQSTSIITMIVYGMPTWWVAMILIMLFVYKIGIFPSGGLHSIPPPTGLAYVLDLLYHLALPLLTLVVIGFWGRAYLTRNIVLSTLQEDYIMAARARGLSERKVLYGHTLRSAAPPIATMSILSLLSSVSGGLIFEGIFSWPGMGNLYWVAIQQNDIPVLMGNLALTTLFYLSGLVLLDLIYGMLDPRIKVGGKA
ncbi:MAG TPA: ABC transporter permease [Firmicutes bacterium]|jgi:peptide/nickel transport system permease protein|nr:ABC transporter permease [Bacillota bacterium]HBR28687.1 ABC transporter permease [Bacillota bacterium]